MTKVLHSLLLAVVFFPFSAYAQGNGVGINGRVLDEKTQEPIIGAAISLTGTAKTGAVSDADGNFFLLVPSLPVTLLIDYLGYKRQEIEVYESAEPLTIFLSENRNVLDEVVVVGYTTAKKSSYTGSVAVVGAKELEKLQVTTIGKALQGTVPGLQSIASAGQPGSDASLFIRGIGSVNASTSPLYVVDGIPGASVGNISGKDIQSISVLKDATASALYGSRGANGVIVITTKSGNLNAKPTVNFSSSYGFTGRAVQDYDYLTMREYHELQWEAIRNTQLDQGKTAAEAAEYASANLVDALKVNIYGQDYPVPVSVDGKLATGATPLWNDDWGEAISRTGIRQQYDLSVSGGSANTKYFFSGGYLNENGWIIASEYERFHLRTSLLSKVNSWFEAGTNISVATSYRKSPTQEDSNTGNYANFQRLVSNIYPVYERNPDGTYVLDENGNKKYDYGVWRPSTAAAGSNIPGSAAHSIFGSKSDAVAARTNFNITFREGLLWKTTAAVDYSAGTSHSYSHSYYSTGVITEGAGSASRSSSRDLQYTVNSFIDYSQNIKDKHFFNLLAGPEVYVSNSSSLSGSRSGFQVLGKTEPSAGSTSGDFSGTSSDYRLASWLGKFDYDFLHRYYFSASFRRDGSSRFSKQSRWGNFWSVGASWNVKSEDFLNGVKDVNNLNLRLSYGAQGNDNVGNYAYGGFYSIYNSLDRLGLLPSDLPTPDLKWETNLNLNFGVDIALFNNRVVAQIDIYNRQSKDLLFNKPLAPSTGYSGIDANIGSLSNRGIDGQITGTPVLSKDFKWDITLNFGHYINKITKLPQKEIITGNKRMVEGSSIYDFWIKEWAGVNPENGKALWYKNVTDENGNVTGRTVTESQGEATFGYHGSSLPDIYGGLSNTFSYRGFELSFLLSFSIGGYIYDGDYVWVAHSGYSPGRNWSKEALTRWTPENTNTDFPRLSYVSDTWNTTVSTRFLYSATYARLKQLGFSYQLPRRLIGAWNLKNVKLGINGENLLTFFDHQGLDPEQTVSGSTYYRYPAQKTVAFTLDISF
ncbi:MAG: TonB-dependent receptor [Dysgonamonadaceae bacterium]|jgi:TonB-linked SusC/RagA family outer membrane protein|nr:TonB-dependent receptor [Dysgonamonadaceae bacterium]